MKKITVIAAIIIVLVGATDVVAQIAIPGGQLATGREALFPDLRNYGDLDLFWNVTAAPAGVTLGPARVVTPNANWYNPEPDARWISPENAVDGSSSLPIGQYVYRNYFDYSPDPTEQYQITGWYAGDDRVTSVRLNGHLLTSGSGSSSQTPSSFATIQQGILVDGQNVLEAVVENAGPAPNPTGLALFADILTPSDPDQAPPQQDRFESRLPEKGSEKNLVLVTHGRGGEIDWVESMASAIRQHIDNQVDNPNDWKVVAYDWADMSHGSPATVLAHAIELGTQEGSKLGDRNYDHVHLIGHSAGAGLVDATGSMINLLSPGTVVHVTFLDAYAPSTFPGSYGKLVDWADHYLNSNDYPGTNEKLTHAFNVDVTSLSPDPIVTDFGSGHSWPHKFYDESILNPLAEFQDKGFALARESSVNPWSPQAQNQPGDLLVLGPPQPQPTPRATPGFRNDPYLVLNDLSFITNDAGLINTQGYSTSLATGSPVWITFDLEIQDPVNTLSFDLTFTSADGAEGLLAVYFDNIVIGIVDERFTDNAMHRLEFYTGDVDPGLHTLSFRLDPFTETPSSVLIQNVATGLAFDEFTTAVPEPATLALALWSLLAFLALARRGN